MVTLKDDQYQALIEGYLEGQFQEWWAVKTHIYLKLNLPQKDPIDLLIQDSMEYIKMPLLTYVKGKITQEIFHVWLKEITKAIIQKLAPPRDNSTETLEARAEFLFKHIKTIFLDFESSLEFQAILYDAYLVANALTLSLEKTFVDKDHYQAFVKFRYQQPAVFRQKLNILLSMITPVNLMREWDSGSSLLEVVSITTITIRNEINERIEVVFPIS